MTNKLLLGLGVTIFVVIGITLFTSTSLTGQAFNKKKSSVIVDNSQNQSSESGRVLIGDYDGEKSGRVVSTSFSITEFTSPSGMSLTTPLAYAPYRFISDFSTFDLVEPPPTSPDALAKFDLSPDEQQLFITLTFNGLSSVQTGAVIRGPYNSLDTSKEMPIIFSLPKGQLREYRLKVTPEQVRQLRNEEWLISIITKNNPKGEIHGNIRRVINSAPQNVSTLTGTIHIQEDQNIWEVAVNTPTKALSRDGEAIDAAYIKPGDIVMVEGLVSHEQNKIQAETIRDYSLDDITFTAQVEDRGPGDFLAFNKSYGSLPILIKGKTIIKQSRSSKPIDYWGQDALLYYPQKVLIKGIYQPGELGPYVEAESIIIQ